MSRKRLPSLPDTGRRYVENTRHARLASPGLERYGRRRDGGGARVVAAIAVLAALIAAMVALS